MDLLQEGDLLLQCLDASLQVQTGQRGGVHVLPQVRWVSHRDRKWNSGGEWKKKQLEKRAVTHRPERSKVALGILFLQYLFLEPARGSEKTINSKNLDRPNVIEGDRLNRNTRANKFCDWGCEKKEKKKTENLPAAVLIFFLSEQMLLLLANPEECL